MYLLLVLIEMVKEFQTGHFIMAKLQRSWLYNHAKTVNCNTKNFCPQFLSA